MSNNGDLAAAMPDDASFVDSEMKRMFGSAGIDLSKETIDPASEKFLRELIQEKQKQKQEEKTKTTTRIIEQDQEGGNLPLPSSTTRSVAAFDDAGADDGLRSSAANAAVNIASSKSASAALTRASQQAAAAEEGPDTAATTKDSSDNNNKYDAAVKDALSRIGVDSSSSSSSSDNNVQIMTNAVTASTATASSKNDKSVVPPWSKEKPVLTSEQIASASSMSFEEISALVNIDENENDDGEEEEDIVGDGDGKHIHKLLKRSMKDQKTMLRKQTEIMLLLSNQIQDMTTVIASLQRSVQNLEAGAGGVAGGAASNIAAGGTESDATAFAVAKNVSAATARSAAAASYNNDATNINYEDHLPREQQQQQLGERGVGDDGLIPNNIANAHRVAHTVAWRVATFPFRALWMYTRYEYRCYMVLMRLIRREVIDPLENRGAGGGGNGLGGMIFQLGFALFILYGRLGPAIERMFKKADEDKNVAYEDEKIDDDDDLYDTNDDDDAYMVEIDLDNPTFQMYAATIAILLGFMYYIGFLQVFYKFFKHKMHIRIAKDLLNDVEFTPEYGLHFETEDLAEGNGGGGGNNVNENNAENDVNNGIANANNNGAAAGGNGNGNINDNLNNNANNNNRGVIAGLNDLNAGNNNDQRQQAGAGAGAANRYLQAFNNFVMLGRRGGVADDHNVNNNQEPLLAAGGGGAANVVGLGENNNVDDQQQIQQQQQQPRGGGFQQNIIIRLVSNVICLIYSFIVSILPIWNPEDQLRQIREAHDRQVRRAIEQEAEQLRRGVGNVAGFTPPENVRQAVEAHNNNDDGDNNNNDDDSDNGSEDSDIKSSDDEQEQEN